MMRTTVTLDPDVSALLQRQMQERGLSFKKALNEAVRVGLRARGGRSVTTSVFSMGPPTIPLDRALTIAGEIEDVEIARRLALRK
jgi:hypothetical protein